jgi:hypothetical protein
MIDEAWKQDRELLISTIAKLAKDNKILRKGVLIQNKRSEVRVYFIIITFLIIFFYRKPYRKEPNTIASLKNIGSYNLKLLL